MFLFHTWLSAVLESKDGFVVSVLSLVWWLRAGLTGKLALRSFLLICRCSHLPGIAPVDFSVAYYNQLYKSSWEFIVLFSHCVLFYCFWCKCQCDCCSFWLIWKMSLCNDQRWASQLASMSEAQKHSHCSFFRHLKWGECQNLHDENTTYWALPVHTTLSDLDHI